MFWRFGPELKWWLIVAFSQFSRQVIVEDIEADGDVVPILVRRML